MGEPWPDYALTVEVEPMGVPKPVTIVLVANGKPVGEVTVDQVREVLRRWDELEAAYGNERLSVAVAAEREACAQLAEHWPRGSFPEKEIAAAIRARGEK